MEDIQVTEQITEPTEEPLKKSGRSIRSEAQLLVLAKARARASQVRAERAVANKTKVVTPEPETEIEPTPPPVADPIEHVVDLTPAAPTPRRKFFRKIEGQYFYIKDGYDE